MARARKGRLTANAKALMDTKKANTTLIGDIQQHAVKQAMQDHSRRQDIIHPSEMAKADWCPRSTNYRLLGTEQSNPAKAHGHQMLAIFQEGHDIHNKYQTWLGEMGRLWGRWVCPYNNQHYDLFGLPGTCPDCDATLEYKEIPLDAEAEWMICGHADGGVPDIQAMIEIKSIGLGTLRMEEPGLVKEYTVKTLEGQTVVDYDGLFKALKRPLKSHRKQADIYLAIANLMWPGRFTQMVFIYENKANQQVKEFVITYSEERSNALIDVAKDIKWAVEAKTLLPRPSHHEKNSAPCKECVFRDTCWGEISDDSTTEQHASDDASLAGGEEATGSADDRAAGATGGRVARTAGRPHRTQRQRTDAPVRGDDEVGGVPEHATGRRGGRRTVRRSTP